MAQSCFQGAMNARQTTGDFLDRVRNLFHKKKIDGFQAAKEVARSADALRRAAWTTAPPATWAMGRVFASRTLRGGTAANVDKDIIR